MPMKKSYLKGSCTFTDQQVSLREVKGHMWKPLEHTSKSKTPPPENAAGSHMKRPINTA